MLQFVFGRPGTGKTESLYLKIHEAVQAGENAIFLLPEQASFESEKQLYRRLGPQNALKVDVLSFTRLCHRIFREYGGLAGIHMEDNAKILLMSVALESVQDSLQVYRQDVTVPLIESMCAMIHEMKSAGVLPFQLYDAAKLQETEEAKGKLQDIALLMEAYQALVEQGYDDPDDHLMRASEMVRGRNFFQNTHIFVDGFTALMGAEWEMIRAALHGGATVTAALCCENLNASNGVFGSASATARRLSQIAAQCGTVILPPIYLTEQHRYVASGIATLAEEFPQTHPDPSEKAEGVHLLSCEDFYDEVEIVAAQIAALARKGFRYREMVVIARDTEPYQAALEMIFPRYGIPYFDDRCMQAATYPLIRGVLCALDAVQSGFESEYILSLAKCGLIGLSVEQAGCLENYCYVWSITRKAWRTPFQSHPEGLKTLMSEEMEQQLAQAEAGRLLLLDGLIALESALDHCNGKSFAASIFHYLERTHAVENLHEMAADMSANEEKTFLEEGAQIWDAFMGILDIFGGVLGEMYYPTERFISLLRLCVEGLQIGMLPQTLDQVLVGGADRIRPNAPKAAFVIGLNEGQFPARSGNGGLLSNGERERLREAGVDILHTADQQALLESYYVYFAITRASHVLWLTWPERDTAGKGRAKSSVVYQVERLFPGRCRYSTQILATERIGNWKSAMDFIARSWRTETAEQAVLRGWLYEYAPETYEMLGRISEMRPYRLETPEARDVFGGSLRLSTTRLEKYALCPFSFFCDSGLKLNVRHKAEFNAMEAGTIIHYILQEMVKVHGGKGLATLQESDLRSQCDRLLQKTLEERLQGKEMPKRFQYLFARQVDVLVLLLHHLGQEFSQSVFVPAEVELEIGLNVPCKPLSVQASDGSSVYIEGKVDRLDTYEKDDKRYLRVIDYKTGIKKFELSDICQGKNLQMLIYLFSLCDSYGGSSAWRNTPAGVLYVPARSGVLDAKRETIGDALEAMRDNKMKMNGLLVDDDTALEAMEPGLAGRFIPAKATGKGTLDHRRSTVVSPKQFAEVRQAVEKQLTQMVDEIKAGNVEALPMVQVDQQDGQGTCNYCDFSMICLHELDDPCRELSKLSWKEALKVLGVEMEDEEDDATSVDTATETGD